MTAYCVIAVCRPVPYDNEAYSANGNSSVFADGDNLIANFGSRFERKCPNDKKETETASAPASSSEKNNSTASYFALGGLIILGVAASICPFDGPVGDIAAWSAVSAQAASMSF